MGSLLHKTLDTLWPTRIKPLTIGPGTRIIVMSDMHRGDGSGSDDFAHNSVIYKCALDYYFSHGFTYIELGDGEELWEVGAFDQIYITHSSVYDRLRQFHDPDPEVTRYIKVWGNHDEKWEHSESKLEKIFKGIHIYEAVIIDTVDTNKTGKRMLLWHGHQADPMCSGRVAKLSKFFVRHFWPRLQHAGVKDPTRAATNPGMCAKIDETLSSWARENDKGIDIIIAGHTHRPVYENLSLTERRYLESGMEGPAIRKDLHPGPFYYNTGSCVHPRCITGLEITMDQGLPGFKLVKWGYGTANCQGAAEHSLTISRTVLEPEI